MDGEKDYFPIRMMSGLLGVSRSGYYKWQNRLPSHRETHRRMVKAAVKETYHQFHKRYGAPRIARELNDQGISCSLNHVAQLLQELDLKAHNGKGFRYSSSSTAMNNVTDNLINRRFAASAPNQKWVADLTYIHTCGKWLYLAVVMDLYSRIIVGWSLANHMRETLICDALDMALSRRQISSGLIVHSDRGVQYRSNLYQQKLLEKGCRISMSLKGNCYDNAVVESFFSRIKVECIYPGRYQTLDQAKLDIFEYIEVFYNRIRKHSALGYKSPVQYEQLSFN